MMWVPLAQVPLKLSSVSLRVQPGSEGAIVREASAVLKSSSAHLMVRKTSALTERVAQSTARERMLLRIASGFGALAILLAAVGVYGTLAVTRRTREIGVRMALGAQRTSVARLVLGESLKVTAGALLVGVPLSLAAGRLLRTFLFGITIWDFPTLVGAGVILTAVSLVTAFVPAHRASRVDPMLALKYE